MQCNKLEIKKARNGETCGPVARKRNKQNENAHACGRGAHEVFSGLIVTTARMTACAANKKNNKKKRERGVCNLVKKVVGEVV